MVCCVLCSVLATIVITSLGDEGAGGVSGWLLVCPCVVGSRLSTLPTVFHCGRNRSFELWFLMGRSTYCNSHNTQSWSVCFLCSFSVVFNCLNSQLLLTVPRRCFCSGLSLSLFYWFLFLPSIFCWLAWCPPYWKGVVHHSLHSCCIWTTSRSPLVLYLNHVTRKSVFGGVRLGKIQTGLLSYRDWLESSNVGFSKYMYYTV